jgi:transposase
VAAPSCEQDPERLADLVHGRLKASRADLVAALHGRVTAHHRFLLQLHLTHVDALERAVREVEARLGEALAPFRSALDRLITMPGVSETVARVLVAEIGFDMTISSRGLGSALVSTKVPANACPPGRARATRG